MKNRSTILPVLAVLASMAAAPIAFAQPPGGPGGPRGGMHGRHDGDRDLVEFLGLSEEQTEQWKAAHKAHFEALRPTFEKMRDLREQMKAELESASPDAATVGGYVISIHQLEGDLEASRGDLESAIKEILTDEQETKLEAFKAAHPDPRRGFGGPGAGWGGPHHDHPGRPGDDDAPGDDV